MTESKEHGLGSIGDIDAIGAPIAIIRVTPDDKFYWEALNKPAEKYFGATHEQLVGKELEDLRGVSERNVRLRKRAVGNYRRCVESRSQVTAESKHELNDGTYRWAQNTFSPIFGESGAVERILVTTIEITELKETQERLEEALTRLVGGFVTICAACKKVKNEREHWTPIEHYIDQRIDVEFSHGLCPPCYDDALLELKG